VVLCVALCCVAGRSIARAAESAGQTLPPRRFSLEFRDADIKDVLRLLGQENDLNILVGDDVTGKVTVSFKEVTLPQALDAILESFGYSYSTSDGIVVVRKDPLPKPTPEQIVIVVKGGDEAGPAPAQRLYSIDCRDADVKDVLRTLGQKSGLNVIVGDEVTGKITVSLKEVTLDQALLSILQSFGCSYSTTDGIVLVTRNPVLGAFVSRAVKILYLVDSVSVSGATVASEGNQAQSAIVETQLKTLATTLEPMLSSPPEESLVAAAAGSAPESTTGNGTPVGVSRISDDRRGDGALRPSIKVFPRINTLVITDSPERVDRIVALIKELDKPFPQIKIEARIVEVKDIYQKELGIQWGAQFNADAAHGNALPYAFPNSVNVGGTQGTAGNYLVNLPANSPVAGVGISMGHIANVLSLDLKLSAMEKMDKIKILSTPSVMAMQGKEAVIKVGEQIPYISTTTNSVGTSTQTVSFKDIVLQLRVVPSVLPEGRIVLDLVVNKDTRGQEVINQNERNFSVDTKSVTTRVSLLDGETGVIGGLYTQQETGVTSQVPLLGRIPLLGWLFRSRGEQKVRNELLIFLTPRVQPL
jgi:type IV pilus assembly protein PilQ